MLFRIILGFLIATALGQPIHEILSRNLDDEEIILPRQPIRSQSSPHPRTAAQVSIYPKLSSNTAQPYRNSDTASDEGTLHKRGACYGKMCRGRSNSPSSPSLTTSSSVREEQLSHRSDGSSRQTSTSLQQSATPQQVQQNEAQTQHRRRPQRVDQRILQASDNGQPRRPRGGVVQPNQRPVNLGPSTPSTSGPSSIGPSSSTSQANLRSIHRYNVDTWLREPINPRPAIPSRSAGAPHQETLDWLRRTHGLMPVAILSPTRSRESTARRRRVSDEFQISVARSPPTGSTTPSSSRSNSRHSSPGISRQGSGASSIEPRVDEAGNPVSRSPEGVSQKPRELSPLMMQDSSRQISGASTIAPRRRQTSMQLGRSPSSGTLLENGSSQMSGESSFTSPPPGTSQGSVTGRRLGSPRL